MSQRAVPYDGRWVGVAVPRKEDRRMLLGRDGSWATSPGPACCTPRSSGAPTRTRG